MNAPTGDAPLHPAHPQPALPPPPPPHAVARLRAARLARSAKPFLARGGMRQDRCAHCRLARSHCLCGLCVPMPTHAGVCLLMADIEPLKPSNTGWLVADVVQDTFAFGWARTQVDAQLLALLTDPQWQPYVVFPAALAAAHRVVYSLAPTEPSTPTATAPDHASTPASAPRPLLVVLDATWSEAGKMFRKSPYLDRLPVLSVQPEQASRYRLRHAHGTTQLCTSEVVAHCLSVAGDHHAAQRLQAYLDVFSHHYEQAKNQRPVDTTGVAYQGWLGLGGAEHHSAPTCHPDG